jgi:hypothetical protein
MNDPLSLSIFTIEVDRTPVFAIECRKHSEAEALVTDESIRDQLGREANLFAITSRFSASDLHVQMNGLSTTKTRRRF